jgi:hypothetical protein
MRWNFHRGDYAITKREELEVDVNIFWARRTMMSSGVSQWAQRSENVVWDKSRIVVFALNQVYKCSPF